MNILVIETATPIELIALSVDERIFTITEFVDTSHSTTIFRNISHLLLDAGITIHDINCLGVGIWPGSFTGIRIAVSTARMLAQILNCPLVGIDTPRIFASSVKTNPGEYILVAFDAKKQRVFGALYQKAEGGESLIEILKPGDYSMEFMLNSINPVHKTFALGDGSFKYNNIISETLKNYELIERLHPSAEIACALTRELYNGNPEKYDDPKKIVPLYTRKSDAEVAKNLKSQAV